MIRPAFHGGARWPMISLAVAVLLASSAAASTGRSLSGFLDDVGCACDADSRDIFKLFFGSGFCRIKRAVRPVGLGLACRCTWKPLTGCYGKTEPCLDPNSPACKNPSTNLESCLQGDGNCRGYIDEACSCGRTGQGCALSKAPPPNTACKCMAKTDPDRPLNWYCVGFPVACADANSPFCTNPDTSLQTCQQGLKSKSTGGIPLWKPDYSQNCDGYEKPGKNPSDTAAPGVKPGVVG